jgi:4-hydroxy-tetrahydrodipicolinate reductase
MGRLIEQLAAEYGFEIALKLDEFNNAGGEGITREAFEGIDAAIDFSIPSSVADNVEKIAPLGVPIVIGTTGWQQQLSRVQAAVERDKIGLVYGANFSVGVQAFFRIVDAAARTLAAEEEYDAWAHEAHHKAKKDAPSGTMLHLLGVMESSGYKREINVATNRVGHMPGTHEIGFDSEADTIRLVHVARNRNGFARGALRAARWIVGKQGLYEFSTIWEQLR